MGHARGSQGSGSTGEAPGGEVEAPATLSCTCRLHCGSQLLVATQRVSATDPLPF